jgi:hypothetical protein
MANLLYTVSRGKVGCACRSKKAVAIAVRNVSGPAMVKINEWLRGGRTGRGSQTYLIFTVVVTDGNKN